jgi:hypothetical protein
MLFSIRLLCLLIVRLADSAASDVSDDEKQRASVQAKHMEEKENEIAENDDVDHKPNFNDNDNHCVPPSPPILQKQSQSIVVNCPRIIISRRKHLIEECNIVHYAMSCAEWVENDFEPATYTKSVASIDREK